MYDSINVTIENEYPYYRLSESGSLSPGIDMNNSELFSQISESDSLFQDQKTFTTAASQHSVWLNESNNTSMETESITSKFIDNQRSNFIKHHSVKHNHIDTKGSSDRSEVLINIIELQRVRRHSERSHVNSPYKCSQKSFAMRRYSDSSIDSVELEMPKQVSVQVEVHRTCNSPELKLPVQSNQIKEENLSTKQNEKTCVASKNHVSSPHRLQSKLLKSKAASYVDSPPSVDKHIEYEHKVEKPTIKRTKRERKKQENDPLLTEYLTKTSKRKFVKEFFPRLLCGWNYNWDLYEVHYGSESYKVPKGMEAMRNVSRVFFVCFYLFITLLIFIVMLIIAQSVRHWLLVAERN
ncbi:hypothetical protein TKK_0018222 [Trichogramma kaykai]|uniref:Uncharacterized protein n=1 Tax=Trichogramma kaykai TaxID=54128 RepID=A0ABD2VZ59_9HYME